MDYDIDVYDDIAVTEYAEAIFALWVNRFDSITIADSGPTVARGAYLTWNKDANITLADETTAFKEGTGLHGSGSMRINPAVAFTTGKMCWKAFPSAQDFSAYTKISFWIQSNTTITANMFKIQLCSDTAGNTPVDEFTIDIALQGGRWYPITLARNGGGSLGSSIQSVVIYAITDPSTNLYYFDNMIACNDLTLNSVIGKKTSSEPQWYPIKSINGTTITLAKGDVQGATVVNDYFGTSETVETWSVIPTPTKQHLATTTSTVVQQPSGSGSGAEANGMGNFRFFRFEGGYNTATGVKDGITLYDGLNGYGYGLNFTSSYVYLDFRNIGLVRYYSGIYGTNVVNGLTFGDKNEHAEFHIIGCSSNGFLGNSIISRWLFDDLYIVMCGHGIESNLRGCVFRRLWVLGLGSGATGLTYWDSSHNTEIYDLKIYGRSSSNGIVLQNGMGLRVIGFDIRGVTYGFYCNYSGMSVFKDGQVRNCGYGVQGSYTGFGRWINVTFSNNTTRDISPSGLSYWEFYNCAFNSTTKIVMAECDNAVPFAGIVCINRKDVGNQYPYYRETYYGITRSEPSVYRTASPSMLIYCKANAYLNFCRLRWQEASFTAPVTNGVARTMSIWLKRDADFGTTPTYQIKVGVRMRGDDWFDVEEDVTDHITSTEWTKVTITLPADKITYDSIAELCIRFANNTGTGSIYADDFEWS